MPSQGPRLPDFWPLSVGTLLASFLFFFFPLATLPGLEPLLVPFLWPERPFPLTLTWSASTQLDHRSPPGTCSEPADGSNPPVVILMVHFLRSPLSCWGLYISSCDFGVALSPAARDKPSKPCSSVCLIYKSGPCIYHSDQHLLLGSPPICGMNK